MPALKSSQPQPRPTKQRMRKEITGRHVLFLMLGFFAVIIATDSFLVYKAISTFGGIETARRLPKRSGL